MDEYKSNLLKILIGSLFINLGIFLSLQPIENLVMIVIILIDWLLGIYWITEGAL